MHHLVSKVSKRAFSSVKSLCHNASCSSTVTKHNFSAISSLQRQFDNTQRFAVHLNLSKRGSLGFCRTLSFASGFTPLQQKPLDSIMDVDRAKTKSPEELADIWDDFHLGRGHIGVSMNAKLCGLLEQRASDCRYFVIPLWKGSGYTTMFLQG
ncbi:hypothetical protein PHJA_002973300 [Phtheirospermum japonicum]|uniref:Uncharacterized protein n=1 Tax=Phtheirospermum japonicum TaxID=374723 RepID=A0A830DC57_9LAMI|nr:hypothetical protein PHJA_002973300 [Phtheirospermum japonicum]